MTGRDPSKQRWKLDHDPFERPLGCNGKYGTSGLKRHFDRGEDVCELCRVSHNHYRRELKRGQGKPREAVARCGTPSGARRHNRLGEELCRPCKLADAAASNLRYRVRKVKRQAVLGYACYPQTYEISCAVFRDGR